MSLTPLIRQVKRNDIKAGVHIVSINDMSYLRNGAKEIMKTDGFPTIIVQFKKSKDELHEKHYLIDKGFRKKYFDNLLRIAQVDTSGGAPKKSDVVGKQLWISIQEVHYVNDDQIVLDENGSGNPKIDYNIFKVFPYVEGGRKPILRGDPESNDGIASEDFITYKNISKNTEPTAVERWTKKIDDEAIKLMQKDTKTMEDMYANAKALAIAKRNQNNNEEPTFE